MPRRRPMPIVALVFMLLAPFGSPAAPVLAVELTCPTPATATGPVVTAPATPIAHVPFPGDEIEITVFAAASLTDAYAAIGDAITAAHPHVTVHVETAGSQTLVTQLSEGAEADVLATADLTSMGQAREADLIDGEPVAFATNRLVVVTPVDNPAGIAGIEDLAGDDINLVIATGDVPAGRYAREAFCAWAGEDAGALAAIGENVVSEEIDVRSVLTKVQLGEADAGVVYASDAAAAELAGSPVRVIALPDEVPSAVTYPVAPVAGGDTEAARAFIAFVLGDEGQAILASYGFTPVS